MERIISNYTHGGPGQLSWYSESLQAGRSGDPIPVETRFSTPVHTDPGVHLAPYTRNTGAMPEVKRPGRGADHRPPSSTEVKEKVELG